MARSMKETWSEWERAVAVRGVASSVRAAAKPHDARLVFPLPHVAGHVVEAGEPPDALRGGLDGDGSSRIERGVVAGGPIEGVGPILANIRARSLACTSWTATFHFESAAGTRQDARRPHVWRQC